MLLKNVLQRLRDYQKAGVNRRNKYLHDFEERMIYRTTKTENPEITNKMVRDVLHKLKQA